VLASARHQQYDADLVRLEGYCDEGGFFKLAFAPRADLLGEGLTEFHHGVVGNGPVQLDFIGLGRLVGRVPNFYDATDICSYKVFILKVL